MKTQYIVQEESIQKREEFFNYIMNNYNLILEYPYVKELFINNHFPFVVDFIDNTFWICESVTCCAAAASAGAIINSEKFKKLEKKKC